MSYPTQSGTLNRLEAETRKAGRAHEDACVDALKREWEAAKKSLRGIIMAEYHAAHGSETWNLANARMTIERINHFSTNELVGFFNSILRFMRDTVKDAYRHEALRHVWMLDMLTPPSRKPRIPGKALREALRPEDYKTGWEQALAEWLRAYAANLNTNLRLEALHEGSITDAADEVDATKVDNFDPIYKLSSMLFMHILQAQRDARDDVAGENEDLVAEEIFQTLEDSAVCFPAGTLVSTPDGDKAIESLKLGEVILTHLGRKRITGTVCRLYSGSMVTIKTKGAKLITTASHPIYEKGRGWVRADLLDVGDIIGQVGANYRGCISGVQDTFQNSYHDKTVGNEVSIFALVAMPIISISFQKHPSLSIVFNLDVEDAHSYFANGILVHNCPDCDAEDGKPADEAEPIPVHYGCRCFTRIVPRDFAELLRNGTDDEKQAALDMDARGLVPDAMAIRDAEGNLQAHLHVDFDTWAGLHGISIVGWAK